MLSSHHPNLCDRLVHIIESHAHEVTQSTVAKLRSTARTSSYHDLSYGEIHDRVYDVYRNLGRWLWEKSAESVQEWHNALGQKRREEGIPLTEVLWALVMTKDSLLEYLAGYGLADSPIELYQRQEFESLIGHFFDRAVCYTAEGYEHAASIQGQSDSAKVAH